MSSIWGIRKVLLVEDIIPYFIEYSRERFCTFYDGIIFSYCFPARMPVDNIDINQFKKIIQVVLRSPADLMECKFINLKPANLQQVYIGSHNDCDIIIEHPTVSEQHSVINFVSSTEIWITDLRSRFGTMLNDRNIFPDIKTPLKIGDNITFGLVRSYIRTPQWLYSSIATRFALRLKTEFERVVIRYFNGKILKRIINEINIDIDRITIKNALTGHYENYSTEDLKAIFWVKNLIGDPSRVDKQGFIKEADPLNLFIEFKDGECQWGSHSGYSDRAAGFYFYPHDPESNNLKCYIPRNALNYLLF